MCDLSLHVCVWFACACVNVVKDEDNHPVR